MDPLALGPLLPWVSEDLHPQVSVGVSLIRTHHVTIKLNFRVISARPPFPPGPGAPPFPPNGMGLPGGFAGGKPYYKAS